ncbi:Na+/melibiose symporter-like transporter [Halopolyspora algeriensis]|uniref:Putative proline/betaine transporter n=1 Tax=Halopolyspora algeriensis TaxID=1500506 RepID=A0A368VS14_9ACTN|nr:MFS transporter [Halopolyspora algeriensis]RCW44475.1 Na+/melibiose symporter-like transporter [Halopolyspora algeriensis]TQM55836.1 Na+/melibiose symporter-like transporter [Halopolyspora algeriensis]
MTKHPPGPTATRIAEQGKPRRAALAAWVGSALEYYDFFIYGTAAALVFRKIFFPAADPTTGTLLALATFGVGYVARPVGAFLLGHVGDRMGRKKVLIFTLMLMGLSTFLVGCLPTYQDIGILAPVALVVLRLLQGLSAAGEQAGANSMSLEHSPEDKRAYYTSFTLSGTQGGQIIATAVFLPIAALPEQQLLAWGWRIPFWISAVVVLVGFLIRRTLDETPVFQEEVSNNEATRTRLPMAVLFRDHWTAVLRIIVAAVIASVSTIFTVFALNYAVNTVGLDRTFMLWVGVLANTAALAAIPLCAKLADRIGRKPVFITGSLGSAALMFAYLWSISVGNYPLILVSGILMFGVVYSATNGIWPSFYGEMFPTGVRLSGMAIGTQIGFAIAGFMPSIAVWAAGTGQDSWLGVSLFVAVLCLVNVIAVASGRETYKVPTAELGKKQDETPSEPVSVPV